MEDSLTSSRAATGAPARSLEMNGQASTLPAQLLPQFYPQTAVPMLAFPRIAHRQIGIWHADGTPEQIIDAAASRTAIFDNRPFTTGNQLATQLAMLRHLQPQAQTHRRPSLPAWATSNGESHREPRHHRPHIATPETAPRNATISGLHTRPDADSYC